MNRHHIASLSAVLFPFAPAWAQADKAAPAESAAPKLDAAAAQEAAKQMLEKPADTLTKWSEMAVQFALDKGPSVAGALILLIVGWMLAGWVRRGVRTGCERAKFDLTLSKFLANVSKWVLLAFVGITSLGTLGVSVTGFAAILGAAGLAIGLALQGNLGNLASGVLLLVFRPFKIGDAVVVAGQVGVIDGIDLFTTNLDTGDNRRIIIPNGAIFGGVIENQTHHPRRCATINVPIGAAVPFDRAELLLKEAAARVAASTTGALSDPAPAVALADVYPNVVWTVSVWSKTAAFATVRQALLKEVKRAVDSA